MQLEEMTSSEGWKYIKGVMENKKAQAIKELTSKQFDNISEVRVQQTRINIINELLGDMQHQIKIGKELNKKLTEKQSD